MPQVLQGAALEYVARHYDGVYDARVTEVTVGATAVVLSQPNPDRVGLAFIAVGSGNCNISISPGVRATQGIYLGAAGSSFTMNARDDLILPTLGWYAVQSTAATTVTVVEVFRYAPVAAMVAAPTPSGS